MLRQDSTIQRDHAIGSHSAWKTELFPDFSFSTSYNVDDRNAGDPRLFVPAGVGGLNKGSAVAEEVRVAMRYWIKKKNGDEVERSTVLRLRANQAAGLARMLMRMQCPTCNGHGVLFGENKVTHRVESDCTNCLNGRRQPDEVAS